MNWINAEYNCSQEQKFDWRSGDLFLFLSLIVSCLTLFILLTKKWMVPIDIDCAYCSIKKKYKVTRYFLAQSPES